MISWSHVPTLYLLQLKVWKWKVKGKVSLAYPEKTNKKCVFPNRFGEETLQDATQKNGSKPRAAWRGTGVIEITKWCAWFATTLKLIINFSRVVVLFFLTNWWLSIKIQLYKVFSKTTLLITWDAPPVTVKNNKDERLIRLQCLKMSCHPNCLMSRHQKELSFPCTCSDCIGGVVGELPNAWGVVVFFDGERSYSKPRCINLEIQPDQFEWSS